MTDYYSALGIDQNSSPEEIKKAYRSMAMRYHPDRNGGDDAKFKEIQAAYETLSDPDRKAQYDAQRSGAHNFNHGGFHFTFNGHEVPPGFGGFDDIFRQFHFQFGGDPFAQFRQPRRNKDIKIIISVSLESTLQDQIKTINIQTANGQTENVEVKIPRGISNGATIKYPSLGENLFDSLPRGDLYIQVNVESHPNFSVDNLDLYCEHKIDCFTAILGGEIEVRGLDGKVFALQLPQAVQHGHAFRIPEQGLWHLNGTMRGSIIVKINVIIPSDLKSEQLDLIKLIRNQHNSR